MAERASEVRDMYSSRLGLVDGGGDHVDLSLNGCLGGRGLFLKKCLTLRDLLNCSKSDWRVSVLGGLEVGTKVRPLDRTLMEMGSRLLLLRLTMYLFLSLRLDWLSDVK